MRTMGMFETTTETVSAGKEDIYLSGYDCELDGGIARDLFFVEDR